MCYNPPVSASHRQLIPGLVVVSALALVYELIQIRIFSYALHPVVAYSAIAIAMLGFGLGSTILAVRPAWSEKLTASSLGWVCSALAVTLLVVNVGFAFGSPHIASPLTLQVHPLWAAVVLLPCVIPYALAGLLTTCVLQAGVARIGRVYFWNLLGSAIGCALAIVLLRPLGAERVVLACACAAAVAGLLFCWRQATVARPVATAIAAVLALLIPFGPSVLPYQPDGTDLLYLQAARGMGPIVREYSRWDPVGRIDIVRHPAPYVYVSEPTDYRTITNDSGAMSLLLKEPVAGRWGQAIFEDSLYSVPYRLKPQPRVLIIGVGGGLDIHTARHWNAPAITAVEICKSTIDALLGPYRDFAGWPHHLDQVQLVHADGRSFAKRTDQRFDLIQLTGVDTFTMSSASSIVTAEDYLYTIDAFEDFISLLQPEGVMMVVRFGDEAMQLSAIASAALRRLGVQRPHEHLAAVQQGFASSVVIKRNPWTAQELGILRAIEQRVEPTGVRVPHFDESGLRASDPLTLLYPNGRKLDERYGQFFGAMAQGKEVPAMHALGTRFIPPSDDRPYYMLGHWLAGPGSHPAIAALQVTTAVILLASLLLIAIPGVLVRRRTSASMGALGASVVYFFAIGAGFMLLEVGLIHRTIVFVGSPAASVSIVMGSILLSSGVGSYVSDRTGCSAQRRLAIGLMMLLAVGIAYAAGVDALLASMLGLPDAARFATAALVLAPVGFAAGWFFPTGLRVAGLVSPSLVPWAIAVNAFASVTGSLATLFVSIGFGFRAVLVLALALYAAGTLVMMALAWRLERKTVVQPVS